MIISQIDKADKVNSNHKPDKGNKAHRHTVITSQLRHRGTLYLSVISPDILEKDLQIIQIEPKRLMIDLYLSYQ